MMGSKEDGWRETYLGFFSTEIYLEDGLPGLASS